MALAEILLLKCNLSVWKGSKLRCRWCNSVLGKKRRRWCSDQCGTNAYNQHYFTNSKEIVKQIGKNRCVKCGRTDIEVDHIERAWGSHSKASCLHHVSNLQLLCKRHHLQKTLRERKISNKRPV